MFNLFFSPSIFEISQYHVQYTIFIWALIFLGTFTLITFNFCINPALLTENSHACTYNQSFMGRQSSHWRTVLATFIVYPISPWPTALLVPLMATSCASCIWRNDISGVLPFTWALLLVTLSTNVWLTWVMCKRGPEGALAALKC